MLTLPKNNGFSHKNSGRKPLENVILTTSDDIRDSIPPVDDIPSQATLCHANANVTL